MIQTGVQTEAAGAPGGRGGPISTTPSPLTGPASSGTKSQKSQNFFCHRS